jgi:hypothetical protein
MSQYPTEALVDTGAFVLGGDVKWCRFGRARKSGAPYVRVPGCGFVRCEPEQILDTRCQYLTRAEVAERFGITLADLALMIRDDPHGWSRHGRKSIRIIYLAEWAARMKLSEGGRA